VLTGFLVACISASSTAAIILATTIFLAIEAAQWFWYVYSDWDVEAARYDSRLWDVGAEEQMCLLVSVGGCWKRLLQ